MTKPTLEQKIVRAIADGDEAVAEALCRGIFGEDAQEWFIGWLLEGCDPFTEEDFTLPPWVRVH